MSNWSELLQYCIDKQHAFVIWNEPPKSSEESSVGQLIASPVKDTIRLPSESDAGFVIHPYAREEKLPQLFFPAAIYLREDEPEKWDKINSKRLGSHEYPDSGNQSAFKPEYIAEVNSFKSEISQGNVDKVIASRVLHVDALPKSEWSDLYFELVQAYPSAFKYLFYHPAAGVWMGSTPEILLSGKDGAYETMSLAGTLPKNESGEYDWQEKERIEHQWVSDFIEQNLRNAWAQEVQKGPVETVESGPIVHLKTKFSFRFEGSPLALADRLHPTPAISGHPVDSAMRLIQTYEQHDRGYYTGFLGKLNGEKETQLYVNLRCMRLDTPRFELYVGGGITDLSDPEEEWVETVEKAKTLIDVVERVRIKTAV